MEELIEQIKIVLQQKLYHPFASSYIEKPVIDEKMLFALVEVLERTDFSKDDKVKYATAVMLIQIALNTHDEVTLSAETDQEIDLLKRQLTILSGDYYSGLYYQTLAELESDTWIQCLSNGIKEINEYKLMLKDPALPLNERAVLQEKIKTTLLTKISMLYIES